MIQANKFRLGLFVLMGVVLFLFGLFMLGLKDLFIRKAHFVTLFPESVQGLTIGSPVKYKGVPIGTVAEITIQVEDKLIRVDMDINLKAFSVNNKINSSEIIKLFNRFIIEERKKGLRSRLEYAGITGLKYIELDYFKSTTPIPAPSLSDKSIIYVPSTPSAFKDVLKLFNTSLEKISKVDFEGISKNLNNVLTEAKKRISDPRITRALEQIDRAKIAETTNAFRQAANSITEGKDMIANTLLKVNQAIDSFTELLNYLNDDPEALLKGKSKPEIIFKNTVE